MREISVEVISDAIEKLCKDVCIQLNEKTVQLLENALNTEKTEFGKANLEIAIENSRVARENNMPICQDTGMVVVFAEIGQDVHIVGGLFEDAVNEGVRRAYKDFRKSVLTPIDRVNTKDNTPAVVHVSLCKGDKIALTVAPKGFGSENMSALKMLKPSDSIEGIKNFVIETVKNAGANP